MKKSTILKAVILALAEGLAIALVLILTSGQPTNVRVLDAIVTSVIIALSIPFVGKWDRSDDKVGKWVGMLGIFMFASITVSVLAIGVMVLFPHWEIPFKWQLLAQLFLLLCLLMVLVGCFMAGEQVGHTNKVETAMKSGLEDMRSATRRLADAVFMAEGVDEDVKASIETLQGDIRYISPSYNAEAIELEKEYVEKVNALIPAFINYKMNAESIRKGVLLASRTLSNRKSIHN